MRRLLIGLLGFTLLAHAYTYHTELLKIYSKIAPRIMLLVDDKERSAEEGYALCILYEPGDEMHAMKLKRMMEEAYPNGLKGRKFNIKSATFGNCCECGDADLFMLFDTQPERIRSIVEKANRNGIATMAYSNRFLREGVMLSLELGTTVRPYLNLQTAKDAGIPVNEVLLRISKIYQKGAEE